MRSISLTIFFLACSLTAFVWVCVCVCVYTSELCFGSLSVLRIGKKVVYIFFLCVCVCIFSSSRFCLFITFFVCFFFYYFWIIPFSFNFPFASRKHLWPQFSFYLLHSFLYFSQSNRI